MASVAFLASSLEDAGTNGAKAGSRGTTEVIRSMLREQQKDCQRLHANSLFKEFRGTGPKPGAAGPQELVIDFSAEGQSRMFDLIKARAVKDDRPLQGVWASFGKPYVCAGAPVEPPSGLPPLNRDLINAEAKGAARRGRKQQGQQQAASQPAAGERPASQRRRGPSASGDGGGGGGGRMSAAELEEMKLVRKKTQMRFGVNDLLEVKFPEGPLRNAASRLVKSKARVGSYADPYAAEAEAGDPEAAYGQPPVFVHELSLIAGSRDGGGGDEGGRSTVFMTQGGGAGDASEFTNLGMHFVDRPPPPARMSVSGTGQQQQQQQQQQDDEGGDGGGGGHGGSPDAARSGPRFQPLVEPAVPERGKGDNPVYGWHNKFVEARQAGRDALQQALYERSAGRFKARSFSKMGTKLAGLLMADLDSTQGRKSLVMRAGVVPENPYVKMEQAWEAQEDARRVRTQRANALDPNELRVMQRFYDQLCALVEAQRMSDPLCLMVVHRVRAALEGGASLNKSLLQAVIDHIAGFTKGCGLVRHNKYVLSVLTFVAKCAGVNSTLELEDLVAAAGIAVVVYGRAETPAKAAAAAAESAARAHVFSSSRQRSARRLSSSLMRSTSVRHTKGDSDSEGGGGGVSRQLSGAVAGLAATGRRESGTVVTPSTAATESVMLNDELRRQPSARFEGLLPEGSDE